MKMHHYVYITLNTINVKKYIGKHSTNNINDDYMGSGSILKEDINKYGRENFEKYIIKECSTSEEVFYLEKELSEKCKVVENDEWYNLMIGGEGFHSGKLHPMYGKPKSKEHRKKLSDVNLGKKHSKETIRKLSTLSSAESNVMYGKYGVHHPAYVHKKTEQGILKISEAQKNRVRSQEEKQKMSISRMGKGMGENNVMHNSENRKKVGDSKIVKKRVYRDDGSFYMMLPTNNVDNSTDLSNAY